MSNIGLTDKALKLLKQAMYGGGYEVYYLTVENEDVVNLGQLQVLDVVSENEENFIILASGEKINTKEVWRDSLSVIIPFAQAMRGDAAVQDNLEWFDEFWGNKV